MKSPLTGKEMKLMSEPSTLYYRGKTYDVTHHFYLCELTNEKFTTTELDEINLQELNKQVDFDSLDTVKKTQLDELNNFLIDVANTNAGIRRKIVAIEKYLKDLKTIKKPT
jgi:tRNA splicing ligase